MANITKFTVIRIMELALICTIIGLHAHSGPFSLEDVFLSSGTEVAFLITLTGLLAAAMMGMPVNRRVEVGFLLVGAALFIASGAVALDISRTIVVPQQQSKLLNMIVARGSISIIEAAVFLLDAFLIFKREE